MGLNIQDTFNRYPEHIQEASITYRALIFDTADEQNLGDVQETLKWGEPSYLVKSGSTVRMDWKPKFPDQYFIFFNCNTNLLIPSENCIQMCLNFKVMVPLY